MDLVNQIRAKLDEREQIALAASSARDSQTPTGEHWQWECGNCDTPIPIDQVTILDEYLECPSCLSLGVALRSVEEYPTSSQWELSHFVVYGTEEQRPVDALYIIRNDPAAALKLVTGLRKVLDTHREGGHGECVGCNWTAQQDDETPDINKCPTLLAILDAL